jgi:hypothetical protein
LTIQDLLDAGIDAYQSGDLPLARSTLSRVVVEDHTNSAAWLWLGRALADPAQKRFCFQQAMTFDSSNLEARDELSALIRGDMPAEYPVVASDPVIVLPPPAPEEPEAPAATPAPPAAAPARPPEKSRSNPAPATQSPFSAPKGMRVARKTLLGGIGALVLLAVIGALAVMWLGSGGANRFIPVRSGSLPLPTKPQPAVVVVSSATPTPSLTPEVGISPFPATWTPTPLPTRRGTATPSQTPVPGQTQAIPQSTRVSPPTLALTKTQAAIDKKFQLDLQKCAALLSGATTDARAYFQRAVCYWNIRAHLPLGDDYTHVVHLGLKEIDQAIALNPGEADFFVMRALYYAEIHKEYFSRVDNDQIYQVELDNYQLAVQLDPTNTNNNLSAAWALINLGRCQEAVQIGNQLLAGQPDLARANSDFDELMAEAFACQGSYPTALEYAQKRIASGSACNCTWEQGYYLYLTGKPAEAKAALLASPAYNDDRYYLVGLIDLDAGKTDAARQDLLLGEQMTWNRHGLHAYLAAMLALADKDRFTAIADFRDAAASLPHRQSQLLSKVLAELTQLDTVPLPPPSSFSIKTTPIPTLTPAPQGTQPAPTPTSG